MQENFQCEEVQEDDDLYKVERILESRWDEENKQLEYKVKWLGWDVSDSTWEPAENLENNEAFLEFLQTQDADDTKIQVNGISALQGKYSVPVLKIPFGIHLKVEDRKVIVTSIDADSQAEHHGIKVGDIIEAIDQEHGGNAYSRQDLYNSKTPPFTLQMQRGEARKWIEAIVSLPRPKKSINLKATLQSQITFAAVPSPNFLQNVEQSKTPPQQWKKEMKSLKKKQSKLLPKRVSSKNVILPQKKAVQRMPYHSFKPKKVAAKQPVSKRPRDVDCDANPAKRRAVFSATQRHPMKFPLQQSRPNSLLRRHPGRPRLIPMPSAKKFKKTGKRKHFLERHHTIQSNHAFQWGIHMNLTDPWQEWRFTTVTKGLQFHSLGVRLNWRIESVNHIQLNERTATSIKHIITNGEACEMKFKTGCALPQRRASLQPPAPLLVRGRSTKLPSKKPKQRLRRQQYVPPISPQPVARPPFSPQKQYVPPISPQPVARPTFSPQKQYVPPIAPQPVARPTFSQQKQYVPPLPPPTTTISPVPRPTFSQQQQYVAPPPTAISPQPTARPMRRMAFAQPSNPSKFAKPSRPLPQTPLLKSTLKPLNPIPSPPTQVPRLDPIPTSPKVALHIPKTWRMAGSEEDEYTKLLEQHLNQRGAKHEQKRKPRIVKSIPKHPSHPPPLMKLCSPQSQKAAKPILKRMPAPQNLIYDDNFRSSLGFSYVGVSEVDLPPNTFRPSSLTNIKNPEASRNATEQCFNSSLTSYWFDCKSISDARNLPKFVLKENSSDMHSYTRRAGIKGFIDIIYQESLDDETVKCGVCMIPLTLTGTVFSARKSAKSDCYLVMVHQKYDQVIRENGTQVGKKKKNCLEIDIMVTQKRYDALSKDERNICFSFTQRLQSLFEDKINDINLEGRERLISFTNRRACFDMQLIRKEVSSNPFKVNGREYVMKNYEYEFEDGTKPGLWRIDGLYDDILEGLEGLTDDLHRRTMQEDLKDNTFSCTFSNAQKLQRTKFFFGARYIWGDGKQKEDISIAKGIRVDVNEVEEWQMRAADRLVVAGVMKRDFANQFAANIYQDGSLGISPHFDDNSRFYPWIYSLRLFGDTRLSFGCGVWGKGGGRFFVPLPRGAILIMKSDSPAMMKYKHSVRNEDLTGKNGVMIWRRVWEHLLEEAAKLEKLGASVSASEPSYSVPLTSSERAAILRGDFSDRPQHHQSTASSRLSGGFGGRFVQRH